MTPIDTMMPVMPARVSARPRRLTEVGDDRPEQSAGDEKATRHHDEAEPPVVDEHEEHDEQQADDARDDAGPQRVLTEARRHGLHGLGNERHGQRAVAEHEGEVLRLTLAEVAGDLDLVAGERRRLHDRRRLHEAVEHDRDLPGRTRCVTVEAARVASWFQPSIPTVPDFIVRWTLH